MESQGAELVRVQFRQQGNPEAEERLVRALSGLLLQVAADRRLTVVCVGTPLNTGDALGPLVGTYLAERLEAPGPETAPLPLRSELRAAVAPVRVRGTLAAPITARNLPALAPGLRAPDEFVLALDAAVGVAGEVVLARGPLRPGAGLGRTLPAFGDAHLLCAVSPHPAGFLSAHIGEVLELSRRLGRSLWQALAAVQGRAPANAKDPAPGKGRVWGW